MSNFASYLKNTLINYGVAFIDPCTGTTYNQTTGGNTSVVTDVGDGTYIHNDGNITNVIIDTRAINNPFDGATSINLTGVNNVSDALLTIDGLLHDPVTVTDSSTIDFTLVGQDITGAILGANTATIGQVLSSDGAGGITWSNVSTSGADEFVKVTATDTAGYLTDKVTGSLGVSHVNTTSNIDIRLDFTNLPINTDPIDTSWIVSTYNGSNHVTIPISDLIPPTDSDWFISNTTNEPTDINDNIYTMGLVGINTTIPNAYLNIVSSSTSMLIRAEGSTSGNHFRVLNDGTINTSYEQNIHIVDSSTIITSQGTFNVNIGTNGHMLFSNQGTRNITLGAQTAQGATIGDDNIILGTASAKNNTTIGSDNVFLGKNAALNSEGGISETILGSDAGVYTKFNGTTVAVGQGVYKDGFAGLSSTAIGNNAANEVDAVSLNTFLGSETNVTKITGTSFTIDSVIGTTITASGLSATLITDGLIPTGDPISSTDSLTTGDFIFLAYDNGGGMSWHRFLITDLTLGTLELQSTPTTFLAGANLTTNTNNRVSGSTAVGYSAKITKSNQIVLGNTDSVVSETEELLVNTKYTTLNNFSDSTGVGVPNNSRFRDAAGNLYWKGGAGTITLIAVA